MHDGTKSRDPADVEDQECDCTLPLPREKLIHQTQRQMLHTGEQWPYLPCSRWLWSPKPIHSCPVLALDAIRNALLHCLDERAALCRQVLVASSSRAVVCRHRAGISALPAVWLGRVGPLDRALEILRRVRGSHRGRLLAGFIEEERKNRGASQTSSETLLPFDIGLISGSCVALIQPPDITRR